MTIRKPVAILGALLFLSLTANVFMGGWMLGKSGRHGGWAQQRETLYKKLPAADRAILKESMQAHKDHFRALREDMRRVRGDVHKAMHDNDAAALDDALQAEFQQKKAFLTMMRDSRAAAMEKMSPEGRVVMEDFGRKKDFGHHPRHGGAWD